jgi:hypothetical protein
MGIGYIYGNWLCIWELVMYMGIGYVYGNLSECVGEL